tara:strand:+ start:797 stop:955 length:159 start_codon:yes stop_codon:yes gene_type:complete
MSISVFKNNLSHSYLGDARLYIIFEDYNYLWFIKEKLFKSLEKVAKGSLTTI